MAKYPSSRPDPYIDQQSGVLNNVLWITDQNELDRVEAALVAVRTNELLRHPIVGNFDLAHLQALHRHLFQDVYAWAGELRSVDITKGSTRFASHEQIESYAPQITRPLAREQFLRNLEPFAFSERAGHYLGELNALHPFREGNGRSIREFVGQLARAAGYTVEWQGIERAEMTQASIESYHGDSSRMASLILRGLRDPEYAHVHSLVEASSGQLVQIVRAEPGRSYAGTVLGLTERYVVQASAERPGEVVLHSRRALLNAEAIAPAMSVDIRYPHGGVGLVEDSHVKAEHSQEFLQEQLRDHGRDIER